MAAMNELGDICESCGSHLDLILLSFRDHHKFYCSECFNGFSGNMYGIDFRYPVFDPVTLEDLDGVSHEFHFRTLLLPTHVSIEALEMKNGHSEGYEFQVRGFPEEDIYELFGQLYGRIRNAMSMRHVESHENGMRITSQGILRGRIVWDEETNGKLPRFVIDGKIITWEELGQMLAEWKGQNFKVEIHDRSRIR